MSSGSARAIAVLASMWIAGCASTPTQVVVVLTAEPELESRTARLRVEVEGPDGLVLSRTIDTAQVGQWPYRVPVVPAGDDARRWARLRARIEDASGALLGEQRAIFPYVEGERRWIVLRFTAACGGATCDARATCEEGQCESACRAPSIEERWPTPVGPCPDQPPDLDAGAGVDAAIDGGGPIDGGSPLACELDVESITFVDRFEAPSDVPAACGEPRCGAAEAGAIEHASRARDGAEASACGDGALQTSTLVSPTLPFAYAAYPVPAAIADRDTVFLRAWVRLQSLVGEHGVLAISYGDETSSAAIADGTVFVISGSGHAALVDRVGSNIIEDRRFVVFPTGVWTCVELEASLSDGTVRAHVDGRVAAELTLERRAGGSLANVAHLRVGLFDLPGAQSRRSFRADDVIIDAVRRPCPPAGSLP